jgi:hypothetical protein
MRTNAIAISVLLLAGSITTFGQVCHNLYPCAECAVNENGGNDLNGYVTTNEKNAASKAGKISEYSGNSWGYIQVRTVKVPSINIHPTSNKPYDLNYSEYIDATLALHKGIDGMEATWWARQCNNRMGALYSTKTEQDSKLAMPVVKYPLVMDEMQTKKFTIVEYNNYYNEVDYDVLLKNYILLENGIVKNSEDYKAMISFYNDFLSKFSYVEDPLLQDKSFITCFTSGKTRYIGYFNMINNKLAGHVEQVNIEYEKDKDPLVKTIFEKLKGKTIIVYGDNIFGLEHNILHYGHNHNLKLIRRLTSDAGNFNTAS